MLAVMSSCDSMEKNAKRERKRKSMPIMYEIVLDKIISKGQHRPGKKQRMKINRFTQLLSIIYHMPKELHYDILKEFEQMGAIKVKFGIIEVRFSSNEMHKGN